MSTAALLAQILLQYGPTAYAAWVEIFHKPEPTKADFLAILDSIAAEDYDAIIAARRQARGLPPTPITDPGIPAP